jgi:predicted TIM-barrel fold metal-dependent hydrolase
MTSSSQTLPDGEALFSADSHVLEPSDLWERDLDPALLDALPPMPRRGFDCHPGATDPFERPAALAADGVCGEILYPTLALHLFATEQPAAQQAAFRLYNDWISDYRKVAPERLFGIGCLAVYDIQAAVAELERCRTIGLDGVMVWQSPHPTLPFHSAHYGPLWEASAAARTPISFHALTGFKESLAIPGLPPWDALMRRCVAEKLSSSVDLLYTLIFHGVLLRHPGLRIVLAENQIGWIPWLLHQWDHYALRFQERLPFPPGVLPSDLFKRQVFATFLADDQGCVALRDGWGHHNCLWSNDFPHADSTWPESHGGIARALGSLTAAARDRLLRDNVLELYGLRLPAPLQPLPPMPG